MVARWAGVAFGLLQVTTYNTMPYPPGIQAAAYTLVGALAVANLAIWISIRRISTDQARRRLSVTAMAIDIVFVSGILWLYAFDGTSALFLLLFVLPAEAAWRFRLRGVITVWAVSAAFYIGREAYAAVEYGFAFDLVSINFRMGILLIVSLILGLMASGLARRTAELEAALQELRETSNWRGKLVDMLAHDIRSPLGSAVSSMETLRDRGDRLDHETQLKLLASSVRSARRVLRLADDLLALARATDAKGLELDRREVPLIRVVSEVLEDLDTSQDVEVDIPPDLRAYVDPMRVEQIVANLVGNALKHGRPPVRITAREGRAWGVVLEVSDAGGGIPAEERQKLFDAFGRGMKRDSVGLGLWIVRLLTEAHGGQVRYEERDGRSRFVVELPSPNGETHQGSPTVAASSPGSEA
ncbi:MAG: ATP-binding protein [Nitriliruptorales bacterium]|nr:ATP-binding protein [Nitriliruptorales bacterium]